MYLDFVEVEVVISLVSCRVTSEKTGAMVGASGWSGCEGDC